MRCRFVWVSLSLLACASQTPTSPPLAAAKPPAPPPSAELIVGSERGLEAWSRDGSTHRRISLAPALFPRQLDADTVLALRPNEGGDAASGARIDRISLRTGKRTTIAELPAFRCAGEEDDDASGLEIQDPNDFAITADRRAACLALMDRNINLADVRIGVHVDLATGNVARWLHLGENECPGVEPNEALDSACSSLLLPRDPDPPAAAFPYKFDEGKLWLREASGRSVVTLLLPDYDVELTSPSGRWLVLGGEIDGADYIYRRLVLLDRVSGHLYPVLSEVGAWPPPLVAAVTSPLPKIRTPLEQAIQIWGEVDVRWLGDSAASELLVVGALIVRPGEHRFRVDGEIAR